MQDLIDFNSVFSNFTFNEELNDMNEANGYGVRFPAFF